MQLEVVTADDLAGHVARRIAAELRVAAAARGVATVALSGGGTPAPMLAALAGLEVPWSRVHVLQVDERVAPDGDPARNLAGLRASLIDRIDLPADHLHPMPVAADGTSPDAAAQRYAGTLRLVAGRPAVLDVVHLGLGDDGHTASLVPGGAAVAVTRRDVAATGPYLGHRRVTLTLPVLGRARRLVWMVAGAGKAGVVARFVRGDRTLPAVRVRTDRAVLVLDEPAAAEL